MTLVTQGGRLERKPYSVTERPRGWGAEEDQAPVVVMARFWRRGPSRDVAPRPRRPAHHRQTHRL